MKWYSIFPKTNTEAFQSDAVYSDTQDTTNPGQSEPGSNSNKGVFHTAQSSGTEASKHEI